jgi:hypothetical protein
MGTLGAPWPTDHGQRRPSSCVSSFAASAVAPARVVARPLPNDSRQWRRCMRTRQRDGPPRKPTWGWSSAALPELGPWLATVSQGVAIPSFDVCAAWVCLRALHLQSWASTTGRGVTAIATAPSWLISNGVAPLTGWKIERRKPWPRGFKPIPTSRLAPGTEPKPMPQAFGKELQKPRRSPTACICSSIWRRPSKKSCMGILERLTSAIPWRTTSHPG